MTRRRAWGLAGTLTALTLAGVAAANLTGLGDHRHYGRPGQAPDEVRHLGYGRVVRQETATDCGPAALKMVMRHHDVDIPLETLSDAAGLTFQGSSFAGLKRAAERFGFTATGWRMNVPELLQKPLPALVKVGGCHFAVVEGLAGEMIVLLDPKEGEVHLTLRRFEAAWDHVALIIERTDNGKSTGNGKREEGRHS